MNDVSKRIGIAKGRFEAPDDLDINGEEAANLLLNVESSIFPEELCGGHSDEIRIGVAKGKVGNTDYFDRYDDEIADFFSGESS